MENYYDWIKAGHIIAMTAWMAGMFYLPRLYAYHADVKVGSEIDKKYCLMESRLLKIIMNPAMVAVLALGLMLLYVYGISNVGLWFHIKITFVLALFLIHGILAKHRKTFIKGENKKSSMYFKVLNEIITVFFVIIVVMVIVKPFDD